MEKDTGEPRGMQSLTVAGRRVEVLHGPTVVAAFHEATLPSGEVHGHLIGLLLHPAVVHAHRECL